MDRREEYSRQRGKEAQNLFGGDLIVVECSKEANVAETE